MKLVKYSLISPANRGVVRDEASYLRIFLELKKEGIICNLRDFTHSNPIDNETEQKPYDIDDHGTVIFIFDSNEIRSNQQNITENLSFTFLVSFSFQTHNNSSVLYIEIQSENYTFSLCSRVSCLDIIKNRIRRSMSMYKTRYCVYDKQSLFYASRIYPEIHETENLFREYLNDVFFRVIGANWWESIITQNIKEKCSEQIKDTRNLTASFKDIQPFLLSVELTQLIALAQIKVLKWEPKYDKRIEDRLNKYSSLDVIPVLLEQTKVKFDLWESYFEGHLPDDFSEKFAEFSKRRNQVAHNKLLDFDSYNTIRSLCAYIKDSLESAYNHFINTSISEEEQLSIDIMNAWIEEQQRDAEIEIAESESGIHIYDNEEIRSLFDTSLFKLYEDVVGYCEDRNDIIFSKLTTQGIEAGNIELFRISSNITGEDITINGYLNINSDPGQDSQALILVSYRDDSNELSFIFTNGEYILDAEKRVYEPAVRDDLNEIELETVIEFICNYIDANFPNLHDYADLMDHLDVMGKASSIVEREVSCYACGETYVCIDGNVASIGTCLNCGAKNLILYCQACGEPADAIEAQDEGEDGSGQSIDEGSSPVYCNYCRYKMSKDD